jgi:hypothetical protein
MNVRIRFLFLAMGTLPITQTLFAQSTTAIEAYQSRVESRIEELRRDYQDKKARSQAKTSITSYDRPSEVNPSPALSSLGAHWQMRAVRYTCAQGLSITTRQQVRSRDFAAAVTERRETSANTTQRVLSGKPLTTQTELDALDDLDASLKKLHPVEMKFKFKTYQLTPERGALGWHYANRVHGISWSEKAGKGLLKNTFSGRILAHDCRAGSPFLTDAPESADADLSAFAKKPVPTN